jgi:hypothetical protein
LPSTSSCFGVRYAQLESIFPAISLARFKTSVSPLPFDTLLLLLRLLLLLLLLRLLLLLCVSQCGWSAGRSVGVEHAVVGLAAIVALDDGGGHAVRKA